MIRIDRPQEPPRILAEEGAALTRDMLVGFRADPQGYEFTFNRDVYGGPEVKQRLLKAQQGKCCFCEVRIVSEAGDVEHFRPKASVRQGREDPPQSPGYFWLAYAWDNLLYACSRCNRENKGVLFPLENPAARASALRNDGSTAGEKPLLLDPSAEDPGSSIEFDGERAMPRSDSVRGRVSIGVLGLNRTKLLEARREALERLRLQVEFVRHVRAGDFPLRGTEAQQHFRRVCRAILAATEARAEFAGMIRCAVHQWLGPDLRLPCSEEEFMAWAQPRP